MTRFAYNMNDLVEKLGHCKRTILKIIHSGELIAFQSAGEWRVLKEELDAYVQRNTHNPSGD